METKTCRKCKIEKPITEYYMKKSCKGGYDIYCSRCSLDRSAEGKYNRSFYLTLLAKQDKETRDCYYYAVKPR